jgi:uncharacterized protein (TIGR00369 family)
MQSSFDAIGGARVAPSESAQDSKNRRRRFDTLTAPTTASLFVTEFGSYTTSADIAIIILLHHPPRFEQGTVPMQNPSLEEVLAQWKAQEAAIRATLGDPGALSMAQVSALEPKEFFEGIARGELPCPPIGVLLDFVPIEWSSGTFTFQGTPDTRHYNPLGAVHGGYAATLLDSCMGCAIHTRLQKGQGYTTLDLRISYVRGMNEATGPVRAEGKVVHVGRSTALAEGRIVDASGRLYATGTTTCMLFSKAD